MDNNAKENVENISKGLKEAGIDSLYSKGYAIHMTLYLTEYKPESLKKIKEVVNKIAKETKKQEETGLCLMLKITELYRDWQMK